MTWYEPRIRAGGTMTKTGLFAVLWLVAGGCPCMDGTTEETGAPPPGGPEVVVQVDAVDPLGGTLHYRWRATDGAIVDVDADQTSWTLPAGPGLHFAYVLVSNGKGGYTERRVAVSTDDIGLPAIAAASIVRTPPAAPAPSGVSFRSIVRSGDYRPDPYGPADGIYLPDVPVQLQDLATGALTDPVTTDVRGVYTVHGVPPGDYQVQCQVGDAPAPCHVLETKKGIPVGDQAINDPFVGSEPGRSTYDGRLVLSDGSSCGTVNEFFGVEATARASLLDAAGAVLDGPVRLNAWGGYGFGADPAAASIRFECEGAVPITIPAVVDEEARTVIPDSAAPVVHGMDALLAGNQSVGAFLPPPSGTGPDFVPDPEFFLSAKGIDSRLSACRYYQAIGAVEDCGADGTPIGAISFTDWLQQAEMDPFLRPGATEVSATYVNRVDLNLTRRHHSVALGPDELSTYVCNHLGPTADTPDKVDEAIANAEAGRALVACVAMDFRAWPGVNGGEPFIRYLIFGPSGELLPSVNLDGRREKFAPGVCVACHGGDQYAGRFPTDASEGSADVGAHFLPYDSSNFSFSTAPGLALLDQEAAIHTLNTNLLFTRPNAVTQELIDGWYAAGGDALDPLYLPASWQGAQPYEVDFYEQVYARSCRTCHVAFGERLNLDHYDNLYVVDPIVEEDALTRTLVSVCAGSTSFVRSFSMPNSLRTHDLFWDSNQPEIVASFVMGGYPYPGECDLHPVPTP